MSILKEQETTERGKARQEDRAREGKLTPFRIHFGDTPLCYYHHYFH